MNKVIQRQLNLPVLVDVNDKAPKPPPVGFQALQSTDVGFHKPASGDDQSIYRIISDNYFKATAK